MMKMHEINKTVFERLQKERDKDTPFPKYLKSIFKFYRDLVKENVDSQFAFRYLPENTDLSKLNQDILKNTNALIRSYNAYSEGKMSTAINIIKKRFLYNDVADFPFMTLTLKPSQPWFRARRLTKTCRRFEAKEMFHIPFEKRTDVVNYRFSISGYPCLYIGNTILSCWEEMGAPSLDELSVSRLQVSKDSTITVLDLQIPSTNKGNKSFDGMSDDERKKNNLKWLFTWPLVIACSIRTITPDASFKLEYVHPQLLMLALVENTNISGVAYTSTHIDPYMSKNAEDYLNVAIPVKKVKDKGLCPTLTSLFKITRGVSFTEMDIKNIFETTTVVNDTLFLSDGSCKFKQAQDWLKEEKNVKLEDINSVE